MNPLDLNTLLYVIGAISLLFGFLMLLYHKLTPTIKGPLQWALGSFSVVIGSFLFAGYPAVPGYLAFVVGGTATVLSIAYYLAGIQLFRGKKINCIYFYGLIGTEFVTSNIFYLVFPNPQLRMSTFSMICVAGSLIVISELLQPARKEYRLAYILVSIVFGISATTSLDRAVSVLILRPEEAHVPISANLIFYFMASVTQALLLFSFLLLISIKIAESIEQKVQDQRKFYSIISHDLSGPIGMVNVMLNMVNHDDEVDQQEKKQIVLEAEKLSASTYHLLQNLLVWSKNQLEDLRPKVQSFDLDKVIRDNIEFMRQIATMKSISIIYEQNPELLCKADSRMVETVIRNLISNALKFTEAGGTVQIKGENDGKLVRVTVSDNGTGMSEDIQSKLFLAKERKSLPGTSGEKGTGLGLAICKEFIDANNGSISVKSKKDEGTEVTVFLPVG